MIGLFERFGVGRAHGQTIVLEITVDLFHQLHTEYPFDFGILMLNLSRDMARNDSPRWQTGSPRPGCVNSPPERCHSGIAAAGVRRGFALVARQRPICNAL